MQSSSLIKLTNSYLSENPKLNKKMKITEKSSKRFILPSKKKKHETILEKNETLLDLTQNSGKTQLLNSWRKEKDFVYFNMRHLLDNPDQNESRQ